MSRPRIGLGAGLALMLLSVGAVAASASPAGAQARVTAQVDQRRLSLHDELALEVTIEGRFDDYDPPDMSAFTVVSRGMTRVIRNRTSSTVHQYNLRPRKAGSLTIGAATAYAAGQVVARSQPITVTVAAPAEARPVSAKEANDLKRYAGQGLFIRLEAARTTFYVGEPFTLATQVYYPNGTQVTGAEMLTAPKLDGFLVEDLPQGAKPAVRRVQVGDAAMSTYPLGRQLLTPLRAGSLAVDAAVLRLGISRGVFDTKRYTRSSQAYALKILEVPSEGRPDAFRAGNLGRFELAVRLTDGQGKERTDIKTGERMILQVSISGRGNLLTVKEPLISDPSGALDIQELPGADDDEITKDAQGMRGTRRFQYLVTALKPGSMQAPNVTFAFFDPRTGRFVTKDVPGRALTVTGDAISGERSAAERSGEDVRPIFEEGAQLSSGGAVPESSTPMYWLWLGLPLLAFVVVETRYRLGQRANRHPERRRARGALGNAKKRLRAAEQAMRDGLVKDFYGQISRTLLGYLEERANLPATGMTHDALRRGAIEVGFEATAVDAMVVELENCDFARFAPDGSASEKMRETLERTSQLLRRLDHVDPRRRP